MPSNRAFESWDPRGARARLVWGAVLGGAAFFCSPSVLGGACRYIAAWDVMALTLLTSVGVIVFTADAAETQRRAGSEDPGRGVIWVLVLAACTISLFAAGVVLRANADITIENRRVLMALCLLAVASSWMLAHAAFTLRYARLYYRGGPEDEGGIEFAGGERPDDFDFAYFAFTIGMCFQVSDMSVTSRIIRRTVLLHGLLSFTYNTVILALALNLAFGRLG